MLGGLQMGISFKKLCFRLLNAVDKVVKLRARLSKNAHLSEKSLEKVHRSIFLLILAGAR